jgi:aryl-alcohol dehydrogenase-like predicted oxidoreductase
MEKRVLGKTGLAVTALGYGGAEIGYQGVAQETVDALIHAALDAGLNVIDTAECYHGSEELIGNAVGKRRAEFVLFTKCGHDGKAFGKADWDVDMLRQSIDRSLKRLQTDHVDLVQLHSCSKELLERGEVVGVLEEAKRAGKTRFIGYSGDGEAALFAVKSGRFDALQTSVSIADQEPVELTLPVCVERGIGVIAKRPVANVAWKNQGSFLGGYDRPYWERLQKLDYDFLKGPLEEAIGTALRFTLSCPGVTTAIVGTSKSGRWKQNAEYVRKGKLPTGEFEAIRARWKAVAGVDWHGET